MTSARACARWPASSARDGDLVDLAQRSAVPDAVPPRLLPAFDPYLLGWRDRGFTVPDAYRRRVYPGGGMLRAVATVDGIVVGSWTLRRSPRPLVQIEAFASEPSGLTGEVDDVVRFESGAER